MVANRRCGSAADITPHLADVRFTPERRHRATRPACPLSAKRWGNRPASLWIAGRFGVLRFRLMVKRGPHMGRQASEGEAQHGLFWWTGLDVTHGRGVRRRGFRA